MHCLKLKHNIMLAYDLQPCPDVLLMILLCTISSEVKYDQLQLDLHRSSPCQVGEELGHDV